MTRRAITLTRPLAVAIARAAAYVPEPRRPAFVRGVVSSLAGLRRPDADAIAQACWTHWRLCGVLPRPKPKVGHPFAFTKGKAA